MLGWTCTHCSIQNRWLTKIPTVEHREFFSLLCESLGGRGVWGRMNTCKYVAESLRCRPETITTLLISYKVKVTRLCPALCDPVDYTACLAPLPIGFSKQKYWSMFPLPSPRYLPDPMIEPMSLMSSALAGWFFPTLLSFSPWFTAVFHKLHCLWFQNRLKGKEVCKYSQLSHPVKIFIKMWKCHSSQ